MNIKKFSRWFLLAVLLLISIKAIIFTGNLILANYFLNSNNKENAAGFMYRIICRKPVIYDSFRDFQKTLIEDFIVKKAIVAKYRQNENFFEIFNFAAGLKELGIERLKTIYPDNFYLQNLFPPSISESNWENLDTVSLELLTDKTLNPLTLSLWGKIKSNVRPEFTANLASYCRWQGNTELADYLEKETAPLPNLFLISGSPIKNESFNQLLKIIAKKNKLTGEDIKENLSWSEDFNDMGTFKKKWDFSCIPGIKDHRSASFTMGLMGLDGTGENHCLRLMGFYAGDGKGITKPSPRGGVMHKEKLLIPKGYYLLSFDYLTVTSREKTSLYLWKGLSEVYLPHTAVQWKKMIYILDNSTEEYGVIKPFIRMWGTGTVLIDNMIFAQITKPSFTTRRKASVFISE